MFKHYYLKLEEDFFRKREIRKLRKLAGGDTFTIIYLKMMLYALKDDGKIYFEGSKEIMFKQLALDLGEEVENVKATFLFLESQNLIKRDAERSYIWALKDITG